MQTLKEYLTEPDYDGSTLLDDIMTITDFNHQLTSLKGQKSFANPTLTRPITTKPHGYITLPSIFDPQNCYQEDGHPESFVDDLPAFLQTYSNWEVTDIEGDNTYNYNSPVEDYINMTRVTIVNPNVDAFTSKDLMFLRVGLGLDPRGGYSNSVIAIFDNDLGEHYDATMFGNVPFDLISGSFIYNQTQYEYIIEGTLANEESLLNISQSNGNLPVELDDQFEVFLDGADTDDLKDTLTKTMNNAFNRQHKIEQLSIEYL